MTIPTSLLLWLLAADRVMHGQPILEAEPRRPVPWTLVDLLVIAGLGFSLVLISQWLNLRRYDLPAGEWELSDLAPDQRIGLLLSFSVTSLVVWALALAVCRGRALASWQDLGLNLNQAGRDLRLGVTAFVMLVVPMLTVHLIAQRLIPGDETHPFIEIILGDPQARYLIPIALAAVVIAPLVEETFFRVLLQGWLEAVCGRGECGASEPAAARPTEDAPEESPEALAEIPAELPSESIQVLPVAPWRRWLPILLSASCFAVAHVGQGPAPISLFGLALGLGYLYQRTHRILPCVTVHFLVNSIAVLQLGLEVAKQMP